MSTKISSASQSFVSSAADLLQRNEVQDKAGVGSATMSDSPAASFESKLSGTGQPLSVTTPPQTPADARQLLDLLKTNLQQSPGMTSNLQKTAPQSVIDLLA